MVVLVVGGQEIQTQHTDTVRNGVLQNPVFCPIKDAERKETFHTRCTK